LIIIRSILLNLQAFNQFRDKHRNATLSEFSREESLLEDKAKLEEEFTERVKALENELKTIKQVRKIIPVNIVLIIQSI
jgi:hypothetical protein